MKFRIIRSASKSHVGRLLQPRGLRITRSAYGVVQVEGRVNARSVNTVMYDWPGEIDAEDAEALELLKTRVPDLEGARSAYYTRLQRRKDADELRAKQKAEQDRRQAELDREWEARQHLEAAAPRLMGALQQLVAAASADWRTLPNNPDAGRVIDRLEATLRDARAAIAEAEGR